jgi:hypothetical protein
MIANKASPITRKELIAELAKRGEQKRLVGLQLGHR